MRPRRGPILPVRIGHLFVQLNNALTEATLLGFLPQEFFLQSEGQSRQFSDNTPIALAQLQPLDTLPMYLAELRHQATVETSSKKSPAAISSAAVSSPRVRLQPWLAQLVDDSWTSLDTLLGEWQGQNLALSFRTLSTKASWIEPATAGIKQGKFLRLSKVSEDTVLLVVGIAAADNAVFDITVEVYPTGQAVYLPPTLHMIVMDESNTPVLQAKGQQSEGLEFKFSGRSGEQFSVRISCEQFTLTELFEI